MSRLQERDRAVHERRRRRVLNRSMNLQCRVDLAKDYKSRGQIARVLSEDWCARELYCPACESEYLNRSKANCPAFDLECGGCQHRFQLKSGSTWNQKKIVDAAYQSMIAAIRSDRTPNLLVMQYSSEWFVQNLLLVPRVFFSESVIEKRKPLGPNARRAGWVGCNILLGEIPRDGRILIVSDGNPRAKDQVRQEFLRTRRLADLPPSVRGWTLDVLRVIQHLGKPRFSLRDLYGCESELQRLHPQNRNIRAKIRQQLQALRDLRLLDFVEPGQYFRRG